MAGGPVWKEIPGHPNYEASQLGEVRRIGRDKPLKSWLQNGGYLMVALCHEARVTRHTVHSLVAITFLGPRPKRLDINHLDHNKTNNAASNLEYTTRSLNLRHAFPLGGCSRSKLNAAKVREIRKNIAEKVPYRLIAAKFKVSRGNIECIAMGKIWGWLPNKEETKQWPVDL